MKSIGMHVPFNSFRSKNHRILFSLPFFSIKRINNDRSVVVVSWIDAPRPWLLLSVALDVDWSRVATHRWESSSTPRWVVFLTNNPKRENNRLSLQSCRRETHLSNLFQSLIIVQEESKILKGDIDVTITAFRSMFFQRIFATAEGMFIDLNDSSTSTNTRRRNAYFALDIFLRVREKDRRVWIGGSHFWLCALQSRKETGVQQRWFGEIQSLRNITRHSEIRILVDGTWNQTGEFLFELLAEDEWKRWTDTRCSLNGGKRDLSNAITVRKTEDS